MSRGTILSDDCAPGHCKTSILDEMLHHDTFCNNSYQMVGYSGQISRWNTYTEINSYLNRNSTFPIDLALELIPSGAKSVGKLCSQSKYLIGFNNIQKFISRTTKCKFLSTQKIFVLIFCLNKTTRSYQLFSTNNQLFFYSLFIFFLSHKIIFGKLIG